MIGNAQLPWPIPYKIRYDVDEKVLYDTPYLVQT
jgi:hypothetical protein